jgi:predicted permease
LRPLRRFLKRLFFYAARQREDRLAEELAEHLALLTAEYIRAGFSPHDARRRAWQKLGPVESVRASYREEQGLPVLDDLLHDIGKTLRQLRKNPLFTLTATASLAMGIGATAGVFTVVERVLLRPLPVARPHELVYITDERILTQPSPRFSYPFYEILRDNDVLDGTAARSTVSVNATVDGQPIRIRGELVSGNYFSVVGAGTHMGRPLSPEDDVTPGAHAVAVISDAFWRRSFASNPSAIGSSVQVNEQLFTIVGIATKGFAGMDVGVSTDVWLPMTMQRSVGRDLLTDARTNWLEIVGRLSSGLQRGSAAAELTKYLENRAPELATQPASRRLILMPGARGSSPIRDELAPALTILMGLAALAVVLAGVNVASLVAVRCAAREREFAIRLTLGAPRSRVGRQLLTEALVLAMLGGAAALLIAPWIARGLAAFQRYPLDIDSSLDLRVIALGILVSVLTGFGVAQTPLLVARKVSLVHGSGHGGARPALRPGRLSAHELVLILQIALSLAMLVGAALFAQSVRTLSSVDPGFRADSLILASLDPKAAGYDASRIDGFWRSTLERVGAVPGVQDVSIARVVPLGPDRQRQPWTSVSSGEKVEIDTNFVGPRYFRTLEIPLVGGREFDERDGRPASPVVIVNERLARMFWPDQDPIGKGIRLPDSGNRLAEVVGVVRDVKYRDLVGETEPMFYRPALQTYSTDAMTLHVRASSDPASLVDALRAEIQSIDRNVPLFRVTTLDEQLNVSFAQTRQAAMLTGIFGLAALLLSGLGVYGVTSLAVARRTRDIGIRMALGAQSRDIARTVGGRASKLVLTGIGIGLLAALAFTQLAGSLLLGVTAADSLEFAEMAALLAFVSLVGVAIPVRRAMRQDVVAAIHHD